MRAYFRSILTLSTSVRLFLIYNLFASIGFGVFQLVFNLYLLELGVREDGIGAINAAQTIAMAVGGLSLGYLVNRLGSWRCVAGGFGVFLLASIAIAFAEARWVLYALSVLFGLGLAFLFNTTMPFLMEWCGRERRGQAAAVTFSLISLSITLGSLLGGFLPDLIGSIGSTEPDGLTAYRWTLVTGTLFATFGAVPLVLMHEARRGRAADESPLVAEPASPLERRQVRADMGVFVLVGGIMAVGVGMVFPFYNVFLVSLGANARDVGFVFALGSLCAAVIGLSAPAVAKRFGALDAVFLLRVTIAPLYILLILWPSLTLAVLAHLVRQTTISMAWPIDSTFIGELLPPRARASVFGLRSAAWNLVSAVAAFAGGKIIVRTGYDWTFASIAVFTALSAVIFTVYYRRHPLVRAGSIPSALKPPRKAARDATYAEPAAG
jgi:MFS family permease